MAVIFFDGFSANRPRNDRFWGFAVNAGESESDGRVFGSTEKHRNGTSPNSGALKFKAFGEAAKQQAQTCFLTTQSDKKLFFGFAVSGLQLYPTGTDATGAAFSPPAKRKLKLFELKDDTSPTAATVLTVYAAADLSPTKLLLCVNDLTTEYEIPLDAITDFDEESAVFNTHTQSAFVVRQPGTEDADFIYLEFSIDMTDETETVLACRFNDIPLFLTNAEVAFTEDLILPTPLTNVAAIKFYGGITKDLFIDDFYVSDSTGTVNTTFLGRETRILSPNLVASEKTDWTVVSNQTPANPTLNTVDVENYITSATANQISTFEPAADLSAVLVAAVSMTSYARKTALNARYEHVYQRLGATTSLTGFSVSVPDNVNAVGSYCLDGTHNGKPKYKKASNNWYIFYDSSNSQWAIAANISSNSYEWAYNNYSTANDVPTTGWNTGMGSSAYPTITSEACIVEEPDSSVFSIGSPKIVTNLSYTCPANSFCSIPHTTVVEQNPETSARWTIAEINSGTFGVRSLTPPL